MKRRREEEMKRRREEEMKRRHNMEMRRRQERDYEYEEMKRRQEEEMKQRREEEMKLKHEEEKRRRQLEDGGRAMKIEAEGPILFSTTRPNRTFVIQQLRKTVERLRGVGAIR